MHMVDIVLMVFVSGVVLWVLAVAFILLFLKGSVDAEREHTTRVRDPHEQHDAHRDGEERSPRG